LPGSITLTCTPSGAISAASESAKASIACLLMLYTPESAPRESRNGTDGGDPAFLGDDQRRKRLVIR
jgi:hypothetical protein